MKRKPIVRAAPVCPEFELDPDGDGWCVCGHGEDEHDFGFLRPCNVCAEEAAKQREAK